MAERGFALKRVILSVSLQICFCLNRKGDMLIDFQVEAFWVVTSCGDVSEDVATFISE
jgi:hypothetical protein